MRKVNIFSDTHSILTIFHKLSQIRENSSKNALRNHCSATVRSHANTLPPAAAFRDEHAKRSRAVLQLRLAASFCVVYTLYAFTSRILGEIILALALHAGSFVSQKNQPQSVASY
jgi:hypothetical protein